ncbi:MAG: hypothetical protein ACT4OY_06845 [Alphaproteobacteria bacterium]
MATIDFITATSQKRGVNFRIPIVHTREDFIKAAQRDMTTPVIWRPTLEEVAQTSEIFQKIWESDIPHEGSNYFPARANFDGSTDFPQGIPEKYRPAKEEFEILTHVISGIHDSLFIRDFTVVCSPPFSPGAHSHNWSVVNRSFLGRAGTTLLDDGETLEGDWVFIPKNLEHEPDIEREEKRMIEAVYSPLG